MAASRNANARKSVKRTTCGDKMPLLGSGRGSSRVLAAIARHGNDVSPQTPAFWLRKQGTSQNSGVCGDKRPIRNDRESHDLGFTQASLKLTMYNPRKPQSFGYRAENSAKKRGFAWADDPSSRVQAKLTWGFIETACKFGPRSHANPSILASECPKKPKLGGLRGSRRLRP